MTKPFVILMVANLLSGILHAQQLTRISAGRVSSSGGGIQIPTNQGAGFLWTDGKGGLAVVRLPAGWSLTANPDGSFSLTVPPATGPVPTMRTDDVDFVVDPDRVGNNHVWVATLKGSPQDLIVFDGGVKLSPDEYTANFDQTTKTLRVQTPASSPNPGTRVTVHYWYFQ